MSALSIQVPFPVFNDRDGQPLDNGYVWIGVPNLPPQTNPVNVYFDEALTILAPQPLRTINGYISRAGSPAQVYIDGVNFSILVQDSKGTMVYNFTEGTGISPNAAGVVYDPAGIGAVPTTVQAKLRETISVKDFGAVGDGVTDDTAAIQAAANAASGQILIFPPGEYVVTNGFGMTGDGSIISGYGATLLYGATTAPFFHCIRISGNNTAVLGIKIKSPPGLVRDDTGFGISAGVPAPGTSTFGLLIQDCIIEGVASAGIWVSNVDNCRVESNTVVNCLADGIHFSDGCDGIVVSGNTLLDNEDDNIAVVNDVAGAPYVSGFAITGNYINCGNTSAVTGGGIVAIGATGGVIDGNTILNTVKGGVMCYQWVDIFPTDLILISNNKISNCGRGTGPHPGLGILLSESNNVTIQGNYISQIAHNASVSDNGAIVVKDGNIVVVSSNTFTGISTDGVVLTTNGDPFLNLVVTGNTFGTVLRTPVLVGPSATLAAAVVESNQFLDTVGTDDINLNNASALFTVFNNLFKKNVVVSGTSSSRVHRIESQTFTPTITAQTGTITTASGTLVYQLRGAFVDVSINLTITDNGTGSQSLVVSLPFNVVGGNLTGRENNLTGNAVTGTPAGTSLLIRTYNNLYPAASGAGITLSGVLRRF